MVITEVTVSFFHLRSAKKTDTILSIYEDESKLQSNSKQASKDQKLDTERTTFLSDFDVTWSTAQGDKIHITSICRSSVVGWDKVDMISATPPGGYPLKGPCQ